MYVEAPGNFRGFEGSNIRDEYLRVVRMCVWCTLGPLIFSLAIFPVHATTPRHLRVFMSTSHPSLWRSNDPGNTAPILADSCLAAVLILMCPDDLTMFCPEPY
jgi:hypothetical protein